MNFVSPQAAIDWIKTKMREFWGLEAKLTNQLAFAQDLVRKARAKNNSKKIAMAMNEVERIKKSLDRHRDLVSKLKPFAEYFGIGPGQLGAIPIALALVAIPVAGLLWLHFQKVQAHKNVLEQLSEGLITPQEAAQLIPKGFFQEAKEAITGIGGTVGIVLIGGLILLASTATRGRTR